MISYADRIWTGGDGDGLPFRQVVRVMLLMEESEAAALMGSFDPGSASSPPAAECRAIARPVAEAIAALDAP